MSINNLGIGRALYMALDYFSAFAETGGKRGKDTRPPGGGSREVSLGGVEVLQGRLEGRPCPDDDVRVEKRHERRLRDLGCKPQGCKALKSSRCVCLLKYNDFWRSAPPDRAPVLERAIFAFPS